MKIAVIVTQQFSSQYVLGLTCDVQHVPSMEIDEEQRHTAVTLDVAQRLVEPFTTQL